MISLSGLSTLAPGPGATDLSYKKSSCIRIRQSFFSERVVNVWNCLPAQIDSSSLSSFTRTVKKVDLSEFLMCLINVYFNYCYYCTKGGC